MRHATAVVVTERHGISLQEFCEGRAFAEFPLGELYHFPIFWQCGPADVPSLRGKTLAQLLEMQLRAPGVLVRYIFGTKIWGHGDAPKVVMDFGWEGESAHSWAQEPAAWCEGQAIFYQAVDHQFPGPRRPFDYFRLSCGPKSDVRHFVVSYGVAIVASVAGG